MAMTKCRACGKQARKTRIAHVLAGRGLKGGRVCQECFDGGAHVVAPTLAPTVDVAKAERLAQREVLAPFIKLFEGQVKALRAMPCPNEAEESFINGKIEGLEGAIEALKGGRA